MHSKGRCQIIIILYKNSWALVATHDEQLLEFLGYCKVALHLNAWYDTGMIGLYKWDILQQIKNHIYRPSPIISSRIKS